MSLGYELVIFDEESSFNSFLFEDPLSFYLPPLWKLSSELTCPRSLLVFFVAPVWEPSPSCDNLSFAVLASVPKSLVPVFFKLPEPVFHQVTAFSGSASLISLAVLSVIVLPLVSPTFLSPILLEPSDFRDAFPTSTFWSPVSYHIIIIISDVGRLKDTDG